MSTRSAWRCPPIRASPRWRAPRQRRHRRRGRAARCRPGRPRRRRGAGRRARGRPRRDRPRGAARRGCRRRRSRGRHRLLRPVRRGGAAGGQQGVRQGGDGRRRRADRARPPLHDVRRRSPPRCDEFGPPYVVKDDGLAAGKGVVVTSDRAEALAHAAACERVVIEEFLDGPEVSLFCLTDGTTVVPLVPAQDFKRIGDGDTGPNTGGMGAYAPLPWLPRRLSRRGRRTRRAADGRRDGATGARRSPGCSTSGWR